MGIDPAQQNALKHYAIQAGVYLGVFLVGALLSFGYSYGPLHSGKDWRIEYLEERVAAKDMRLDEMQQELEALRADSEGKPDTETFKLLQNELATTDKTIQNLEGQLARADRRIKELERSRANWKSKLATAQQPRSTPKVAATPKQPEAAASEAAEPSDTAAGGPLSTPASPAPAAPDDEIPDAAGRTP